MPSKIKVAPCYVCGQGKGHNKALHDAYKFEHPMPSKIKEELTTFILLAEEYLKRHYPNKEEPIDIRWSAVFNFANFLDKLMLEIYMPMIKKAIKEKGFGDAD